MSTFPKAALSNAREQRIRSRLRRDGYLLQKSRNRGTPHLDDMGGYRIVWAEYNAVAAGSRFELDLDDVEEYYAAWTAEPRDA